MGSAVVPCAEIMDTNDIHEVCRNSDLELEEDAASEADAVMVPLNTELAHMLAVLSSMCNKDMKVSKVLADLLVQKLKGAGQQKVELFFSVKQVHNKFFFWRSSLLQSAWLFRWLHGPRRVRKIGWWLSTNVVGRRMGIAVVELQCQGLGKLGKSDRVKATGMSTGKKGG